MWQNSVSLGPAVDAWLAALRTQGLSDRRVQELAGLLGNAMGDSEPQNVAEARALRRFERWHGGQQRRGQTGVAG
ncbi:hypothetical protein [Sulfobacillus harzensis]|uniref:Uncharacterized protein n=1 Tax=Sulfobacillus harzensis TaxID=2729629 RepID=A0A7Y0L8Z6_9FIRM|nr:hypothetical protein [Sulfobacillus harzensis]NMP24114.1 hypothetical protein [Sulfobacillus harzensis]